MLRYARNSDMMWSLEATDQVQNLNFIQWLFTFIVKPYPNKNKTLFPILCQRERKNSHIHLASSYLTTVHFTFSLIHPVQNQKTYSSPASFDLLKMKSLTICRQKD